MIFMKNCRRVRAVQPAKVSLAQKNDTEGSLSQPSMKTVDVSKEELLDKGQKLSISVMLSKPILALEFSCLKMQVEAPVVVSIQSKHSLTTTVTN